MNGMLNSLASSKKKISSTLYSLAYVCGSLLELTNKYNNITFLLYTKIYYCECSNTINRIDPENLVVASCYMPINVYCWLYFL